MSKMMKIALFSSSRLIWILVLLAVVTRVAVLWYPQQVVFDEVHFGKFVTAYCCTGERFFDIHPPHAKLLIAGVAYLGGYRGDFDFEHIGEIYSDVSVVALRMLPALMGAAIPLLAFILLRQLGVSDTTAFVAGLFLVFDNALIVQSRLISLDAILISATFGALVLLLAGNKSSDRTKQTIFLAGAGALAGLAIGVKLTGLAALAIIGVYVLRQLFVDRRRSLWLQHGLLIVAMAAVVYIGGWYLHFNLLDKAGDGDVWGIPTGSFITDTIDTNKKMLSANYNLTQTHPYSSKWWTWPTMQRPVFYWVGSNGGKIYFLGNPIVWWGSSLLIVAAVVSALTMPRYRSQIFKDNSWLLLAGYIIAYLPFVRVPRALFLYHYLTPLIFAVLAGFYWLDKWLVSSGKSPRQYYLMLVLALIVSAVFVSPLTYGFPSPAWQSLIAWFPSWQ